MLLEKKEALEVNEVIGTNLNMFVEDTKFSCSVKLRYRAISTICDVEKKITKFIFFKRASIWCCNWTTSSIL